MTTTLRFKRRVTGSPGAPSALKSGEIAYNMVDGLFYVGYGDDGGGNATSVKAIAKDNFNASAFVPAGGTTGQVLAKSSNADYALSWTTVAAGTTYTGSSGVTISGSVISSDFTVAAPLASPTFTGTPAAPTPTNGDSSTKVATTAFVLGTRLDQHAAPTAAVGFNAQRITGLADPTSAQDAATKAYVDANIQGLKPKGTVRAISVSNIASLSGTMTVDGIALAAGDRVLLTGQTTASQNGVWVVSASAWSRALDMDVWAEVPGAYVMVELGTVYSGHGWINTNDPDTAGTIGTTAMTWQEFTGASDITAGNGITKGGNTLSVNYGSGLTVSGSAIVVDFTVAAALASPAFTGNPTAPTQASTDNSTKVATTAFVQAFLAQATIDGGTF